MKTIPKTIIVADDDPDDLFIMETVLEEVCRDSRLIKAEGGKSLMHILDNLTEPPHVIILDLNMPSVTGLDCLKYIRSSKHAANWPVLLFSTSTSDADRKSCLEQGADNYVSKPSSSAMLRRLAGYICNGEWRTL